jgi:hypothetical protein
MLGRRLGVRAGFDIVTTLTPVRPSGMKLDIRKRRLFLETKAAIQSSIKWH